MQQNLGMFPTLTVVMSIVFYEYELAFMCIKAYTLLFFGTEILLEKCEISLLLY
jgi:hypothetical protein